MLLRLLSLTASLYLGSWAAAVDLNLSPTPEPPLIPDLSHIDSPRSYQLNLSCLECAFAYGECSENTQHNAFLTIDFTTKNDALLANGDIIFPAPFPMEFKAVRHWDSSHQSVLLAYALDVMPLPHQPGKFVGDLYRLRIKLLDLQGRRATENHVSIPILRDADGNLEIIEVEESPRPHRFYHHRLDSSLGKWWHPKTWRSFYTPSGPDRTKSCASDPSKAGNDGRVASHCHGGQNSLASWTENQHHFLQHVRPAILPGLFGMAAGIIACIFGFLIGKIIVSVYYYYYDRETESSPALRVDVEEGQVSEKQRLAELYGDPAFTQSSR